MASFNTQFNDPRFQIQFWYPPSPTPSGEAVAYTTGERDDMVRVHLASASAELYIEIMKLPAISPQQEYTHHAENLSTSLTEIVISDLRAMTFVGLTAFRYSLRFPEKTRTVIVFEHAAATYRLIYNPLSPLNEQVLATIALLK